MDMPESRSNTLTSTPSLKTGHAAARRFWFAMAGFVMALALLPFSYKVERHLETAVHIKGGESEKVDMELAQRFQSPYAHRLVLVISGIPDPDSAEGADALGFLTRSLRSVPGVSGAISSLDWPDPLFTGNNGGALIIIGLDPHDDTEALIPKLRAKTEWMESQLRSQYPKIKLEITGETPLNFDLRKVSADDVTHAEERAMPVTLVLLLLAFGSFVAALLPLGVGLLSISMALGAAALLAHFLQLSILVQNLATMLGLGLGIDYALLMVSRFREALAEGYDPGPAADIAARQAGRTLIISATTVAIGFSALLTVPISELRSIGIAGLLVTVLSVMLCTFILPWVLSLLGHRIDSARVCLSARRLETRESLCAASERWVRWGSIITRWPGTALLVVGIPLLLLAYEGRKISPGVPDHNSLPAAAESVKALHTLQGMGRSGIVQSLRVILELPPQSPLLSPAGWLAVSRLTQHFQSDPRAEEVLSLPTLTGMSDNPDAINDLPEPMRKSFRRADGQATLIELLPATTLTPNQQIRWVRDVRASDVAAITGVPGASLLVGGVPALEADYDSVVKERMPRVVLGVILGSLLALLIGLRCLFAAVKAILLNLLSVGASFGALVVVFQEGHGGKLFGLDGPTGSVYPIVPILAFAIVFGLSMDYEVFLVTRVLEERRRGLSERAAVIEGLARTAGLITSAAAIMIAVFVAFTVGSFLVVQMLGFTLAVAVFIDATVVRMIVGPALLQLAGDWNWWPFGLHGAPAAAEKELVP
ncbi:MAG: MMPL family transporter [Candidatus Sulfotelmatobacter sp.]